MGKKTFRLMRSAWFVLMMVAVFQTRESVAEESARYQLIFESVWSSETNPTDFPGAQAHYSGLVGGTHNQNVTFWAEGELATSGIERMAEFGSQSGLKVEVESAISAGNAEHVILGRGLGRTPGSVDLQFDISQDFPLVTITTMIAPSPDWFVGTSGLSLLDDSGNWIGRTVYQLHPYDSGTDSGTTFRSLNADTIPPEPIHSLRGVFPFENGLPLGTFTFLRLVYGDVNETGTVDADDIDALTDALMTGDRDRRFDLNDDNKVTRDDREMLVHDILYTYYGDANLDGEFNSSDLTLVFQASEYEDGIAANSRWRTGDWNGDREFDSSDLVFAFREGAYESGPRQIAVVPEPVVPTTLLFASLALAARRVTRRTR